jgi:fructose-bisphosphate aldolase class II
METKEQLVNNIKEWIKIDTDIRLAMTAAVREYLSKNPEKFDPRDFLKPAREAAKAICVQRYQQFGTAGNASKIKVVPLTEVASQYAAGKLAQVVQ